MENKAIGCIFVKYDQQRKCWKHSDPTNNKASVSCNVVFDEGSACCSSSNVALLESKFGPIQDQVQHKIDPSMVSDLRLEL